MKSLPSHMRFIGAIIALALSLTACTAPWGGWGPPIPVQPKLAGAKGLDVYASQPAEIRPRLRGRRATQILVWLNGKSYYDADCQISNDAFELRFPSFTVLELPDYGRASPPATVSCRAGDLRGQTELAVVNISSEIRQRRSGQSALPGAPMVTVNIPLGRDDRPGDIWGYPTAVWVNLR
ncbi:hypothetical protein [uncultured Roseobacter sp.]|uniref:hypothetical protein n=1 Tax=uncultured Roseobacter sp. TaxID=114847 RepID=UPI00260B12E7|nr:hypothetical protein [uncultured Roseobacter sp.]